MLHDRGSQRRSAGVVSPVDLDEASAAFAAHGERGPIRGVDLPAPPGRQAKLSEALSSFARPVMGDLERKGKIESIERVLKFAALAWNAALGGDEDVKAVAADLAARGASETVLAIFGDLVARRSSYYAHDGRLIHSIRMEKADYGYHLSVLGAGMAQAYTTSHSVAQVLGSWDDPDHQCNCDDHPWADGFGPDDVPDLLALAVQWGTQENEERPDDDPRYWAPFQAWRVLSDLGSAAAVPPLLGRLDDLDALDDDRGPVEFIRLCGKVGGAAVASLAAFLAEPSHTRGARLVVCEALGRVAARHPDARVPAIGALARELAGYRTAPRDYNGLVIAALMEARALELEPTIIEALDAGCVDTSMCGSRHEILSALRGEGPAPHRPLRDTFGESSGRSPGQKAKDKARAQRKRERKAKQKARKR